MALLAARATPTGDGLAGVSRPDFAVVQLTPERALVELGRGDVAVGRLDVRETVDGVDDGLWVLGVLEARGITVLNGAAALLAAHDKLLTARLLAGADVPHPVTDIVLDDKAPRLRPPLVVKPRFGSWGRDVVRCENEAELAREMAAARQRPWFGTHGALVQELVPPVGRDLRVVVAHGRCIGAISRVAAPGEWRTNVALGAERIPVDPPPEAMSLAISAAGVLGASLAGVDLLPTPAGDWVVLEVNGAVEFGESYAQGQDVFAATVEALAAAASGQPWPDRAPVGAII